MEHDIDGVDGVVRGGGFGDGSQEVIAACIEVHRHLGPGLLESVYVGSLAHELELRGMCVEAEVVLPAVYKGVSFGEGFRLDLLVGGRLIIEVKANEGLKPVHVAQLATYLRITGVPTGLLVNFNVVLLRQGLRRVTNGTNR